MNQHTVHKLLLLCCGWRLVLFTGMMLLVAGLYARSQTMQFSNHRVISSTKRVDFVV